jgi:hypothetical protein
MPPLANHNVEINWLILQSIVANLMVDMSNVILPSFSLISFQLGISKN